MRIKDLIKEWEHRAARPRTAEAYAIRLPLHDAARLSALAEMYPGRDPEDLITDLLAAALDEFEAALPYVQGDRVIAEDEYNDPIYEDAGPTPRFVALTRKHERLLSQESHPGTRRPV
jgi:hypothetical protein